MGRPAQAHKLAAERHIDVLISNHSGFDEAPAKLAALRNASHGPNPFVLGEPTVERALTPMNECARRSATASR